MKLPTLGEFRVLTLRECPPQGKLITTPPEAAEYWRSVVMADQRYSPEVETMVSVCLSSRRHILGHSIIATGTLDTILCHPREVFRPAIVAAASAIILMHNHPSGDPTPSEADIKCTRDMIRAGQLMRIEILDHIIIGALPPLHATGYASLRELGYFYT